MKKKKKLYFSIFVGFVNGLVQEYTIDNDKNTLSFQRQWTVHTSTVTGLIYSSEMKQIYSCSKDKTIVWHCSDTSIKLGN